MACKDESGEPVESGGAEIENQTCSRWKALLFPEEERVVPGERYMRPAVRTVHIAAMAVLLGGHFFDVAPERLYGALAWTVGSGALFVLLELYGSFGWLFQVRGLITLAKILLIVLVPFFWEYRVWILMFVVVIASINSHMPGWFRYYSILTKEYGALKKG